MELCKYSGKPLSKCKDKCGGCESSVVRAGKETSR